jgi:hypothetical protein
LVASYVLTGVILYFCYAISSTLGIAPLEPASSSLAQASSGLLELVSAASVGTFFTAPLALAMFGRGGAWIRHEASKAAKYLSLAFIGAFGSYLVAAGLAGTESPASGLLLVVPTIAAIAVLLVATSSPLTLLEALSKAVDAAHELGSRSAGKENHSLVALELRVSPTNHVRGKEKPERVRAEAIRFQRLVQALVSSGGRAEFRLTFREGRGKMLILARSAKMSPRELQDSLLGV